MISMHDMFEPGIQAVHQGAELACWATESGMDFIGTPGAPTQRAGHVLDLTFSNIPFAQMTIRTDMHSGSDHETQVTIIPGRGNAPLEQFHFRVPEAELDKFARLVKNSMANLTDPWQLIDTAQIDNYTTMLAEILNSAIQTVGRPDRGGGGKAPWWSAECEDAYRDHLIARQNNLDHSTPFETREFLSTVRKAKREYWRHIIDGVNDDKSLYKVIGWHKLSSTLKAPPLKVNGTVVEDTMEKAEALRTEILGCFSAADNLNSDPLI